LIEVDVTGERPVVRAALQPGWHAFVDADWLPRRQGGPTPALVVSSEGQIQWCEDPARAMSPGTDSVAWVGRALRAVADEAAEVARRAGGPHDVRGEGFIADQVRELLGLGREAAERLPGGLLGTIVDTTGDPQAIAEATRSLASLGTLVLAGETPEGALALDLYPDVHVRGLRLVGVPPPLHEGPPRPARGDGDAAEAVREAQVSLRPGDVVPDGALLYRVSS
jgi:hypothetical protein